MSVVTDGGFLKGVLAHPSNSAALLAERIRNQIYLERPAPGTYLFGLSDLGKHSGLGLSVVREALQHLSASGIVEVRRGPKGGVYTCQVGPEIVTRSLSALVTMNGVSRQTVIEARLEIEGLCARLAAKHATEDDLRLLASSVERSRGATNDSAVFAEENVSFHMMVAEATHNDVIIALTQSMRDLFFEETIAFDYQSEALQEALHAHDRLVGLISDRRVDDAFRLMRSHVHEFNRYVEISGQALPDDSSGGLADTKSKER